MSWLSTIHWLYHLPIIELLVFSYLHILCLLLSPPFFPKPWSPNSPEVEALKESLYKQVTSKNLDLEADVNCGFLKRVDPQITMLVSILKLVCGLEHEFYFSIQLGIIIPTDELHHFSEGLKPPTRKWSFMTWMIWGTSMDWKPPKIAEPTPTLSSSGGPC